MEYTVSILRYIPPKSELAERTVSILRYIPPKSELAERR